MDFHSDHLLPESFTNDDLSASLQVLESSVHVSPASHLTSNAYDTTYSISYPSYPSSSSVTRFAAPIPDGHLDPQLSSMPNLKSMNSAALVAAALNPNPIHPERKREAAGTVGNRHQRVINPPRSTSPLTELDDDELSSESDDYNKGRRLRKRGYKSDDRESEVVENDESQSPVTAERPRRNVPVAAYAVISSDEDGVARPRYRGRELPPKPPRKKRLVRKKTDGLRVPQTLDDASPQDRMMWEWKNMGKSWQEIRHEWHRMTDIRPGTSTLSVRYLKLNENFARHGAAGDRQLLRFKKEAEEELQDEIWAKVAEKMLAFSDLSEHNPRELKKRHDYILRTRPPRRKKSAEAATADAVVKNESEDEMQKSKIVTLQLHKTPDDDNTRYTRAVANHVRGRDLSPSENISGLSAQNFRAPFSYNLDYSPYASTERDNMNATPVHDSGVPTRETLSAAATPAMTIKARHVEVVASDEGPQSSKRNLDSQFSMQAPTSSPQSLASSPFLKTLVAYDSEDE